MRSTFKWFCTKHRPIKNESERWLVYWWLETQGACVSTTWWVQCSRVVRWEMYKDQWHAPSSDGIGTACPNSTWCNYLTRMLSDPNSHTVSPTCSARHALLARLPRHLHWALSAIASVPLRPMTVSLTVSFPYVSNDPRSCSTFCGTGASRICRPGAETTVCSTTCRSKRPCQPATSGRGAGRPPWGGVFRILAV